MTIYINGKFLCQQRTGTQIYAVSMLVAMSLQKIDFQILVPKKATVTINYKYQSIGFFSNLNLWEQISLPLYLFFKKDALLISFCNSAPLFCSNQIITIHDLAFEQKDVYWFSSTFKRWYRFLIPRICRKAKHIFTVSQFSKNELCKFYNLPEQKISLLKNVLRPMTEVAGRHIPEDYLLVLSAENPRKNATFVVSQLEEIKKRGLKLVIVSAKALNFKELNSEKDASVIYFNYVSDLLYFSLLKYAKALVYLSKYEGFGIPVLESLSLRTPVICLDLPVFRESFSDLPLYLESEDPDSFAEVLDQLDKIEIHENTPQLLKERFNYTISSQQILKILNSL